MIKIEALITYDYGKENMKKLEELGYKIILSSERNLIYSEELENVEVLSTYHPFETLDISLMKNLKFIQLFSNGFDQVNKEVVKINGIKLCNNKDSYSIPISEWIIGKVLELLKNTKQLYKNQELKKWKFDRNLLELYGKTVGIVGTGVIAQETAKRLKVFGTTIYGLNTDGRGIEHFDICFSKDNLKEMIKDCDIVISLIPSTESTYYLFNNAVFESMKDNVFFLSCSRGQVVNENDLITYIKNKKIMGACLDVFEKEPLPKNSELWNFENVIISPHNSWISETADQKIFEVIYENFKRYKEKKELLNIVNMQRGY